MKSKTKVLFFLTLLILFLFSSIFISRFSKEIITNNNYIEFKEKNQIQIKLSGFWDLTGNPIYIDDLATGVGAHNWTWAESQPWCSGSGSWAYPYVIENVTIDGQGSGNCIEIKNSDAYFIIRNCSLYNSGIYPNAGIRLITVNNSQLNDNNCSFNPIGINLEYSINNTISGNTATNDYYYGIHLGNSDYNNVSRNNVLNNDEGIHLRYSDYNIVSRNNVLNNYGGIRLSNSTNNTILGNNASYNNHYGISLISSDNNSISENVVSYSEWFGIVLSEECTNNIILGNNISYNDDGISIGHSDYNTVTENTVTNNNNRGIISDYSNYSIISRNNVNNNNNGGFLLTHSNYITISGNTAYNNNYYGIVLYFSNNINISGNTADNNKWSGIILSSSNNINISGNTISNNSNGIRLDSNSNNNKIFLNYFINNEINAEDNGINNTWDNGTIGNYWDDYGGVDANDDGIGDTPYIISGTAGSQDNFPIWADGDEEIPEDLDGLPVISFGNYYILFTFITILSFIILEKRKKK